MYAKLISILHVLLNLMYVCDQFWGYVIVMYYAIWKIILVYQHFFEVDWILVCLSRSSEAKSNLYFFSKTDQFCRNQNRILWCLWPESNILTSSCPVTVLCACVCCIVQVCVCDCAMVIREPMCKQWNIRTSTRQWQHALKPEIYSLQG